MTWRRRDFIRGAGALLVSPSLGGCMDNLPQGEGGQLPWTLWGTTINMQQSAIAAAQPVVSSQLSRIAYKRPTSWAFWFGAEIIDGEPSTIGGSLQVTVDIDIITGVGRSMFDTKQAISGLPAGGTPTQVSFAQFFWRVPATVEPTRTRKKWTTHGRTPLLNDDDPLSAQIVENIVAQDIQCQAKLSVQGAALGSAKVAVTALFAPIVHVRPDWYVMQNEAKMFRGGETDGK